jgi:hypothetical protein
VATKNQQINESRLRDFYLRLIEMNRQAFTDGEHDVAYHLLSAALHCAQRLEEIPYLRQIEQTADEQLKWIDETDSGYQHSTQSARGRGQTSVYRSLSKMAAAKVKTIQVQAQKRQIIATAERLKTTQSEKS